MSSPLSLDDTFGALLIGTYLSLILYGVALHQSFQYYKEYPHDKTWIKVYVAVIVVLETVCSFLTMHICWYYGITSHDNVVRLNMIPWSCPILAIVGSSLIVLTQYFFLQRAWLLSRQYRVVVGAASIFHAVELVMCYLISVYMFKVRTWLAYSPKYVWLITVHNAVSAVSDFLTAGVLIYTLRRSRTGVRITNDIINTLILYTVSTGLVTGLYNVTSLIAAIALPDSQIYCGATIIGIKLYSNSVLAALNSRQSLSAQYQHAYIDTTAFGASFMPDVSSDMELSATSRARQPSSRIGKTTPKGSRDNAIQIKVLRTQEFVHDPRENLE